VSHWPVCSQATVKLVTGAFAALQIDPSIGRAEALRRAEMAMLSRQPAEILSSLVLGTLRRLGTRRCP
jgi:CHAT domain-containing protein